MMVSVSQGQLEKLSELTATPTSQLKFVLDAWAQVRHSGCGLLHSCQHKPCPVISRGLQSAACPSNLCFLMGCISGSPPCAAACSMKAVCISLSSSSAALASNSARTMQLDVLTDCRPPPAATETFRSERSSSLCVQVMDCRRILKWTYAYGYYSFENENNKARQDFFEYTQVRDQPS